MSMVKIKKQAPPATMTMPWEQWVQVLGLEEPENSDTEEG